MMKPERTDGLFMNKKHEYKQMEQEHRAFEELLSNLPEDMVEIAYRAVLLQEEIDEELDPARKQELLKELDLLNQEFMLAARGTDNRMLN